MDCEQIRRTLLQGSALTPEEQAHAESCDLCGALLDDAGATARRLSAAEPALEPPTFASVAPLLAAERAPLAWLRNQSTRARLVAVLGVAAFVPLMTALFAPRPDLGIYPTGRMLLVTSILALGIVLAVRACLWPSHAPLPTTRTLRLLLAGSLVVPLLFAVLPAAHWLVPLSRAGTGDDWAHRAALCFAFGSLLALPVLATLFAADRGLSRRRTFLIGAATLGLAGNLVLQLHCPLTHPEHLVFGHAGIGAAALLGVWALLQRSAGDLRSSR